MIHTLALMQGFIEDSGWFNSLVASEFIARFDYIRCNDLMVMAKVVEINKVNNNCGNMSKTI